MEGKRSLTYIDGGRAIVKENKSRLISAADKKRREERTRAHLFRWWAGGEGVKMRGSSKHIRNGTTRHTSKKKRMGGRTFLVPSTGNKHTPFGVGNEPA